MSNYFDNQNKWSWQITDKEVLVTTDHGTHTHTMDVTNVPIGNMVDHTGQVMGDAHRSVPHEYKNDLDVENTEETTTETTIENTGIEGETETPAVGDGIENEEDIECSEDCEDGLDI